MFAGYEEPLLKGTCGWINITLEFETAYLYFHHHLMYDGRDDIKAGKMGI